MAPECPHSTGEGAVRSNWNFSITEPYRPSMQRNRRMTIPVVTLAGGGHMNLPGNDTGSDGIAGKCVLVVEDDHELAREVCADLKSHGVHVLGPAPTIHY